MSVTNPSTPSQVMTSLTATISASSSSRLATSDPPSTTSTTPLNSSWATQKPTFALFYVALAAGILVIALFIFCTLRYFLRSRFGLHRSPALVRFLTLDTYPPRRRPVAFGFNGGVHNMQQMQLQVALGNRRRQARLRARHRLTPEQVEKLFPSKTYHTWLRDVEECGILHLNEQPLKLEMDLDTPYHPVLSSRPVLIRHPPSQTPEDLSGPPLPSLELCELVWYPSPCGHSSSLEGKIVVSERVDSKASMDLAGGLTAETEHSTSTMLHYTSGTCTICLEALGDQEMIRGLMCGHVFHQECLDPWLVLRNACCPICKRSYYYKTEEDNSATQNGLNPLEAEVPGDDSVLEELDPPSIRAQVILDNPENDRDGLTEYANAEVSRVFRFPRAFFWLLMGIHRSDVFNWAIITRHGETLAETRAAPTAEAPLDTHTVFVADPHSDALSVHPGRPSIEILPSANLGDSRSTVAPFVEPVVLIDRDELQRECDLGVRRSAVDRMV